MIVKEVENQLNKKFEAGLLVFSHFILFSTLIFAIVPLVHFTSSRVKMGSSMNVWLTQILQP
jgi:Mn2+/Fe2+ NRAMP family transporter